jgi:hypothetical protein
LSQIPFQKVPSHHPVVISETPACHVVIWQLFPKKADVPLHHSVIITRVQSLGITSKMPTSTFNHSALPIKR